MSVSVTHELVEKRGFLLHHYSQVSSKYLAEVISSRPENMFRDLRYRKILHFNVFGFRFNWYGKPKCIRRVYPI